MILERVETDRDRDGLQGGVMRTEIIESGNGCRIDREIGHILVLFSLKEWKWG